MLRTLVLASLFASVVAGSAMAHPWGWHHHHHCHWWHHHHHCW
jgi:hypothetical protein